MEIFIKAFKANTLREYAEYIRHVQYTQDIILLAILKFRS